VRGGTARAGLARWMRCAVELRRSAGNDRVQLGSRRSVLPRRFGLLGRARLRSGTLLLEHRANRVCGIGDVRADHVARSRADVRRLPHPLSRGTMRHQSWRADYGRGHVSGHVPRGRDRRTAVPAPRRTGSVRERSYLRHPRGVLLSRARRNDGIHGHVRLARQHRLQMSGRGSARSSMPLGPQQSQGCPGTAARVARPGGRSSKRPIPHGPPTARFLLTVLRGRRPFPQAISLAGVSASP
jgi:hypothetical protein